MAPLLSPAPGNPPGRISQLLPTVKCSNCNRPVPLTELGEHICAAPPPVPTLPKPSVSPAAAASLLPQRLQGRVASPGLVSPRSNDPRFGSSPPGSQEPFQQRLGPPPTDHLRISTASSASSTYQPRSSPLSRGEPDRNGSSPPDRSRYGPSASPTNSTSPLRTRPPMSGDFRARTASNAGSVSSSNSGPSSPSTARPSFSSPRDPNPPYNARVPPRDMNSPLNTRSSPPHEAFFSNGAPYAGQATPTNAVAEREIDTKIGGEAGMAGVGRRGFAAAARAAMFVMPTDRPGGPQPQGRRDNAPRYLNTNIPTRRELCPTLKSFTQANFVISERDAPAFGWLWLFFPFTWRIAVPPITCCAKPTISRTLWIKSCVPTFTRASSCWFALFSGFSPYALFREI